MTDTDPIKRAQALITDLNKAYAQNGDKHQHRPESDHAQVFKHHRPRDHKSHFQIKENEEYRHQVVAHVELHPCVFKSLEAALKRRVFFGVMALGSQQRAQGQKQNAGGQADQHKNQNGKVIGQHSATFTEC